MEELKQKVLFEFREFLRTKLIKEDRVNMAPVVVKTLKNQTAYGPHKNMTPIETTLHLQKAANIEFNKAKTNSNNMKARMITDFRNVNKILRRPGYQMEGSSLIIKKLNPDETCFSTLDLNIASQLRIPPMRAAIILPQGKYLYMV